MCSSGTSGGGRAGGCRSARRKLHFDAGTFFLANRLRSRSRDEGKKAGVEEVSRLPPFSLTRDHLLPSHPIMASSSSVPIVVGQNYNVSKGDSTRSYQLSVFQSERCSRRRRPSSSSSPSPFPSQVKPPFSSLASFHPQQQQIAKSTSPTPAWTSV